MQDDARAVAPGWQRTKSNAIAGIHPVPSVQLCQLVALVELRSAPPPLSCPNKGGATLGVLTWLM